MASQAAESSLTLRRQPFLYLTAALLAGILIDRWAGLPYNVLLALVAVCATASVILITLKKDLFVTITLLAAFVLSGALLSFAERNSVKEWRLKNLFEQNVIKAEDPVDLIGRLSMPPEPAPDAFYIDLEAENLRMLGKVIKATGRARLIVPLRDEEVRAELERLSLDYGSRIRILVRLERARAFANPGSPDFNQFLEQKGYDLKGTIKSPLLIENIGPRQSNSILAALYGLRLDSLKAIDQHFNPPVAGTLKAMLMGNRYYLDPSAEERLRESATFHILSISGMHVAIIAWALLGRWSPSKRRRAVRVMASLIALWGYAVMVGLNPPVTRATLMITVGVVGPLLFRPSVSINTVALAAFVMLTLEPALVADPGFQLSFMAVAAIVSIAVPVISKLRNIGHWRPSPETPHPPVCLQVTRSIAETLFWDERGFNREMSKAPFRYRLDKSATARLLNRFYIQPILRGIVVLIITSAAIQLATLPLSGLYFNRVAPVGILLNVGAGLLTAILMLSGIATILIGLVSDFSATYITIFVNSSHHLLVNQVAPFLTIPGATFRVAHYEGPLMIIYALFYLPVVLLISLIDRWQPVEQMKLARREKKEAADRDELLPSQSNRLSPRGHRIPISFGSALLPATCALGLIAGVIAVVRPVSDIANGKLRVYFLDVGQGDAALVVFPQGTTMLVDGGGEPDYSNKSNSNYKSTGTSSTDDESNEVEQKTRDSGFSIGEMVVSRFLWARGLNHVDYILVTHPHVDHIQGLTQVIYNFEVGQAITARAPTDNFEFDKFVMALTQRRVALGMVRAGERFEIEGAQIEILWPPESAASNQVSGNDDSIVIRLVYGSTRIMLTGDIEQRAEVALAKSGVDIRADLIKTPHHGSRTSSSEILLEAVRPRFAVISVAERNRFGHPHRDVVERYVEKGITLFETRRDGMITAETDGMSIDVSVYKTQK